MSISDRLSENLKGISLSLILRNRRDPHLQIRKRLHPGKQPGLGKLFAFGMEWHGDVRRLTDWHPTDERMISP